MRQAARARRTGPIVGGHTAEERERLRQTWLAEDEDVWTGGLQTSPEVIGAMESRTDEKPTEAVVEIAQTRGGGELEAILAELGGWPEAEVPGAPATNISVQIDELREQLAKLERQRDAERGIPSIGNDVASGHDWMNEEDA